MGRAPYIEGTVVHGDGRGRDLGYPTANLAIDYPVAMPPQGVYAGSAVLSGAGSRETAPSLVSIGTRPTFSSNGAELVEVHLLDRDLDLYGQVIGVELLQLLRGQVRFDDVADLVSQMQRDEADARAALAGR